MSSCDLPLVCSMEGGELFDRIQKKGHFTKRGTLVPRGGGVYVQLELLCAFINYIIIMSPGNTKLRIMCKSTTLCNLQFFWAEEVSNFPHLCIQLIISSFSPLETIDAVSFLVCAHTCTTHIMSYMMSTIPL